jgi:transcriptional regulator with XRE-family HTH domain
MRWLEQAPSEAVTGQVASSDNSVGACGVMITSEQLRAARALLRWKQKDLAEAARVSLPLIQELEAMPGQLEAEARAIDAIVNAVHSADVRFSTETIRARADPVSGSANRPGPIWIPLKTKRSSTGNSSRMMHRPVRAAETTGAEHRGRRFGQKAAGRHVASRLALILSAARPCQA